MQEKVVNVITGKTDTKVYGEKTRGKESSRFRPTLCALVCFRRLFLFGDSERRDEKTRSGEAVLSGAVCSRRRVDVCFFRKESLERT